MDENAWTMESMDISGVGRAPFIRFRLSHDRSTIEADPPGGHIRIAAISEAAERSRITLTSTVTGEVFADIDSRHVIAPSRGDDWNTATAHATEIAASLYWSMWRMQQLQAAAPGELLSSQREREKQGRVDSALRVQRGRGMLAA